MTKKLSLALAILFTIFTLPINGISVEANKKTYDDLADGTYDITAKALNVTENKPSGAANFINEDAKLIIKDDKAQLQITVPEIEMASIDGIQIEKQEAKIEKKDKLKIYTFNLKNVKKELNSQIQYSVPSMNMAHDQPFRFILEDLDKLPKKPTIETKNEKNEETIKFKTIEKNAPSLEKGQTKIEQEGKNGLKEINYKVTYTDGKETNRKLIEEKVIKKPVNKIVLKGTKTNNNKDEETNSESDKEDLNKTEPNKSDKENSNKTESNKSDKNDSKKNEPLDPQNLPNGVYEAKYSVDYEGDDFTKHFIQPATLKVKNGKTYLEFKHKDIQFINEITRPDGKIKIIKEDESTRVVGFNIDSNLSKPVKIGLKMFYGQTHDVNLRLDLDTLKEVESDVNKPGGTESDKIESDKEDSNKTESDKSGKEDSNKTESDKSGKEDSNKTESDKSDKQDSNNTESDKSDNNIETESDLKKVSDKAFTINFSIKHANGKETSVADEFFKKPAMLIEKDGNMYAQLTITNGNMVKNLKTEYGEVNVVKVNKDGSIVVQFKVKKDLSNMKLKMLISVPGLYTAEHDAILVFDKNSKSAIKDNEFSLPGNGDNPKLLSFGDLNIPGKGFNGLNLPENNINHKFGSLSQTNGSHFSGFGSSKTSTPNLNNKLGNTTSSMTGGLDKPEFGSAGSDSQINQVSSNNNPKTGDTSLIWLYGILLVGSLAILVVKLRRRTI